VITSHANGDGAVTFGLTLDSVGEVTTDNYSFVAN
jgi:hypothetical protein